MKVFSIWRCTGSAEGALVGAPLSAAAFGTEIRPQSSATRAQIATMLMRFCENVVK